jgi:anti-sigma regulatory factor (Ser/Thr protein kinase)
VSTATGDRARQGFSHEALFYAGPRQFTEKSAAFIREGLAADEPVMVMVTGDKIGLLRDELGTAADRVRFEDMAEAGRNPGRIISAWNDFASEHVEAGHSARGIGEPIWADRSPDEMVECQHHESLINLAFEHAHGFRLMCPYDSESLPGDVLDEAHRSHPLILEGSERIACGGYRGDHASCPTPDLPVPRSASVEMRFDSGTLALLRRFVSHAAEDAGMPDEKREDLVLAVNEAAANSVRHGGGQGVCRVWREGDSLVCEVRDRGRIDQPLVGRKRPSPGQAGGHGLWLAHQVCDLVQIRSRRSGTVVRLQMRVA